MEVRAALVRMRTMSYRSESEIATNKLMVHVGVWFIMMMVVVVVRSGP